MLNKLNIATHAHLNIRFFAVILLLLMSIFAEAKTSHSSNDSNNEKILKAQRFEDWSAVIKLSKDLRVDKPEDIPAFTASLEACVVRECEQSRPIKYQGQLGDGRLRKFATAWIDLIALNPHRAKNRFEALAKEPGSEWLGTFGLIEYAIQTRNLQLLESALRRGEQFEKTNSLVMQAMAAARLTYATLSGNYSQLPKLLATVGNAVSDSEKFHRRLDYLIWSDQLIEAKATIDKYKSQFGYDHGAAIADFDLRALTISPDRERAEATKLIVEITHQLKRHPNYWELRFARESLSYFGDVNAGRVGLISLGQELPLRLVKVRLRYLDEKVRGGKKHARDVINDLKGLVLLYQDFPDFHVTIAEAFRIVDDLGGAEKHLNLANQQTPNLVDVLSGKAEIALKKNRIDEAISLLDMRIMRSPNDVMGKLRLANALLASQDHSRARRLLKEIRGSKRYVPIEILKSLEHEVHSTSKRTSS